VASFQLSEAAVSRLEAELRKQELRLPRAPIELAPGVGIHSDHVTASSETGEAFAPPVGPLPEPEWVPPPPSMRPRAYRLRRPLYAVTAFLIAMPLAYQFSIQGSILGAPSMPKREFNASSATSPEAKTQSQRTAPVEASTASERTPPSEPSETETPVKSAASSIFLPDQSATGETRKLDPGEIKFLVAKGQQFIALGDLPSARLVFRRAAEAGDAAAALALGSTYDPIVLAKLGMFAPAVDVDKSRVWYERAKALGSSEASRRLELLAKR
jgi:hypothetical protein